MNPAARTNIRDLPKGRTLIVNRDSFTDRNLEKAGYSANPLDDQDTRRLPRRGYPLTSLTLEALKSEVTKREAEEEHVRARPDVMAVPPRRRAERSTSSPRKFQAKPEIAEANTKAFKAGWAYGETSEDFRVTYEVAPADFSAGHLPQHPRQPGADARADRRVGQERPTALPRRLPDHAGVGDPRGRFAPQGLRRPDLPGGGRDLRRRRRLGASFGGALGVCTSSGPGSS